MSASIGDARSRAEALDPSRSFIVQAPAGSGKTELLIQRYLTLLGRVEAPEEIVAITFTRKVAAEMRGRVLGALTTAAAAGAAAPQGETTLDLARCVLEHAASRGWHATAQPERFRIETLDALNASLAYRLPVLSGGVASASITEDAQRAYRHAALRTLERLSDASPLGDALKSLLSALGRDVAALQAALESMLEKREQWLPILLGMDEEHLRSAIAGAAREIIGASLDRVDAVLPAALRDDVAAVAKHAARHTNDDSLRERIAPWLELDAVPAPEPAHADAWRGLASLLLTKAGTWRRQVTKAEGFGPGHEGAKGRFRALLEALRSRVPSEPWAELGRLPRAGVGDETWEILGQTKRVLEHAVAELRVEFAESRQVDFSELSMGALSALGRVDDPSDLLLALDRRIRHILVDEYQDTSKAQYRLLELLTAGWTRGDGRTLFLVGDPMQSIYRFRNADVSLFVRTRAQGIGSTACKALSLTSNFRSSPAVIDWVNGVFRQVSCTGTEPDRSGDFEPSVAVRSAGPQQFVRAWRAAGDTLGAEHDLVLELLRSERSLDPQASIGVLVQSRAHLEGFRDRLRGEGWPVRAVEIDAPNRHQVVQDLIGLCRALTHFADRIAWLGLLRAPWCGLPWSDLEALVAGVPEATVWELVNDDERLGRISEASRQRLEWVRAELAHAFAARSREVFPSWIERTWRRLGGAELLLDGERALAEQFFTVLDAECSDGDLDDPERLEAAFSRPQREPDDDSAGIIDLMTIHRAKGLEFDAVVLFGLNRIMRSRARELLIWSEFLGADGRERALIAPGLARESELVRYLRDGDARAEAAERARLAYVATTRARERLHLVWSGEKPDRRSLLACLGPALEAAEEAPPAPSREAPESRAWTPPLRRFRDGFESARQPSGEPGAGADDPDAVEFAWAGQAAVQVGSLVHRYLQSMARDGLAAWPLERVEAQRETFRAELELLGVEPAEADSAAARVVDALTGVVRDARGTWILRDWTEADSELELTSLRDGRLEHMRLDRTFVDESGTRWIVDFKTSTHEGTHLRDFLDEEVKRYRPQLARYARAMREIDPRPVRLALYFPLLGAFREIDPPAT